jgi:putative membrane protein insertion efficiency factor
MKRLLLLLLRGYKVLLSPALEVAFGGGGCKFEPTCSVYMAEAIQRHGAAKGLWLGTKRLCRCHPWNSAGGFDPVPFSCQAGETIQTMTTAEPSATDKKEEPDT